ncbi:MAG: hypothetical protein IT185_12215, partial [Acidobacteria bacterium]|nr:hypothetical protein [Acidobacteriota bacterium]
MTTLDRTKVRVSMRDGLPVLLTNGRPRAPLMFFFNTEVEEGWSHLEPQVRLASEAGVHLYSLCLPWPWWDEEPDFARGERFLQAFVDIDPEALFIPRMRCEGSEAWLEAHPEARLVYADGSSPLMNSMASDEWWKALESGLDRAVRHYESSPFADRIVAYHPAGQNTNEWFHYEYWLHGPDHSQPNRLAFQGWLAKTYGSEAALREAWGRRDVRLDEVSIPEVLPVCPRPQGSGDSPFHSYLTLPEERPRADFQAFTNDIMAERLEGIARIVKRAAPDKLVLLFYGYTFEMHAAESGHFAMERMIGCPDVDLFSSPLSYLDRTVGGPGSFMTAVDSLPLHGKMWIVENDYRTHSISIGNLPSFITEEGLGPR